MPSTTKDPLPETGLGKNNDVQGSQPGNAASAEIPVIVHASRYSAASQGAGKLPPVHEETRTVIILPQGAVVRLSATVTPGELVVLTNKRTGADVICRVTSVKTQPGIQNYVHLEFTQRAVDFWEENSGTERGTSPGKPGVVTTSPKAVPSAPASIPSVYRTPSSPARGIEPAAKASAPSVEVKSAPAPLPKITPLADAPTRDSDDPVKVLAAELQASEISPTPAIAQKQPPALRPRTPRLQPFEAVIPQKQNTSAIVLFAIAAVVLLAIGAVAGAVFLRRNGGTIVAPQFSNPPVAATGAPLPAASRTEAPIFNASNKPNSLQPPASALTRNAAGETPLAEPAPVRASVEPAKEVQPPPVTRPLINVGKISAPRVKTVARLNSSEPPPILPAGANSLPGVIGDSVSNTAAHANLPAPAEPAPPAPVKGGQLQQPKLLSSVASAYPPLARAQHVQGDVVIDALIDATGNVSATNVVSGSPLLQKAAIDSLRLWKYQPALLNGEPIPIHINVTIVFHLN